MKKTYLSHPAPGENLLSGNLVMETGCISNRTPTSDGWASSYHSMPYMKKYIYIYICICICIYIYIYLSLSIYIYIYMYIHLLQTNNDNKHASNDNTGSDTNNDDKAHTKDY